MYGGKTVLQITKECNLLKRANIDRNGYHGENENLNGRSKTDPTGDPVPFIVLKSKSR